MKSGRIENIRKSKKTLLTFEDYRYVYLFYNPKNGKTKIGITNNLKSRENSIESSKDDFNIRLVFSIKIYNAENNEKKLHYDYHEFLKPDKEGNGRTEWFILTWWQRQQIKCYLIGVWVIQQVQYWILAVFIFISILMFFYYQL